MQYVAVTKAGTGRSKIVVVDDLQCPFSLGIAAVLTSTATFSIEYSLDDPYAEGYSAATATWFVVPNMGSLSATTGGSLSIPCRALSINVASGAGSVTMKVVQAGPA
jgi:hypothetical protein